MIISGTYPAFYLSSFSPVKVMKSAASTGSGKSSLRKLLVIAQFTISIVLIISTLIITQQMIYIKNKELGFDKDHLVYVELLGNLKTRFDTVKNELLRNPNINSMTTALSLPNNAANNAGGLDWEGKPADVRGAMNFISVEKDYFKTVGIEFLEGETFKTIPDNLSINYIKWVILAIIIALPVAYFSMDHWLRNFAYRFALDVWIFVFAGIVAIGIALLTVSYQTIKAATANPVDSLRYE
jgi:hypothetical protein